MGFLSELLDRVRKAGSVASGAAEREPLVVFVFNSDEVSDKGHVSYGPFCEQRLTVALKRVLQPDPSKPRSLQACHGDLLTQVAFPDSEFGDSPVRTLAKWVKDPALRADLSMLHDDCQQAFKAGQEASYVPYLVVLHLPTSTLAGEVDAAMREDVESGYRGLLTIAASPGLQTVERALSLPNTNVQLATGRTEPDNPEVARLVQQAKEIRNPEETIEIAERILDLDAEASDGHGLRGWGLEQLGSFEEAVAAYRQAVALDPRNATALYRLASVLHVKLYRFAEAVAAYDQLIALEPPNVRSVVHDRTEAQLYADQQRR